MCEEKSDYQGIFGAGEPGESSTFLRDPPRTVQQEPHRPHEGLQEDHGTFYCVTIEGWYPIVLLVSKSFFLLLGSSSQ